jgi:hypothetical protein
MGGKSATLAWQRYCATVGNALWWASCALPCCTTRHSAHAAGRAACCTSYSCAMRRCVRAAGGVACCAAYSCAMRRCVRAAGGVACCAAYSCAMRRCVRGQRLACSAAYRCGTRTTRCDTRPGPPAVVSKLGLTAPIRRHDRPAGAMVAPSPGGQVSPPRRCRSRACAAPRRYELSRTATRRRPRERPVAGPAWARIRRLPAPLARCRRGKAADARGARGGGIGPPPRHPRGLRSRQVSGARSAVPCSPPRLGHRGVRGRTGWGRGLQADEEEPAANCGPRTSTPGKSRMSLL